MTDLHITVLDDDDAVVVTPERWMVLGANLLNSFIDNSTNT